MATQVNNGAGFEYACASALLQQYRNNDRQLFIDQQTIPGFKLRRDRFDDVKPDIKEQMTKAAKAVAHHLTTSNESWGKGVFKKDVAYQMRVGDDARNMDVRDLVIYSDRGDQLGVSLKWNSSRDQVLCALGITGLSNSIYKIQANGNPLFVNITSSLGNMNTGVMLLQN